MWSRWALDLADGLEAADERVRRDALFAMLGYDATSGRATGHGRLAATPMARLRDLTRALLDRRRARGGRRERGARPGVARARPGGARPARDRPRGAARCDPGARTAVAIATTDDRDPTTRTIAALGIEALVDAVVCADDGVAAKPDPAMIDRLCAGLGVPPARAAMVGDSIADLAMGRAAGVARSTAC